MWPRHDLTELLGIRHPILQAPMAGAASPALAAAVSRAGALGGYGGAGDSPERLQRVTQEIREAAKAPFNINLFTPSPEQSTPRPELEHEIRRILGPLHEELDAGEVPGAIPLFGDFEEKVEVLLSERVPVVSFHFGAPDSGVLRSLRENGTRVLSTATTPEEAEHLLTSGVDAIIAQGQEAGGHQGVFADPPTEAHGSSRLGTLALVPQVADRAQEMGGCPVIAAGGIMDRRGIDAAFALGASGVQIGTAFLTCHENSINPAYRRRLLEARANETVITTAISGRPARAIRNRLVEELEPAPRLSYPEHYSMSRRLRAAAAAQEDPEWIAMWAGQGVDRVREWSAAELLDALTRAVQST